MNLYRRTLSGYLEKHSLESAGDLLTENSHIYTDSREDKEMLDGLRLILGMDYSVHLSQNFLMINQWEWFTYDPRKHF